eukprot:SAG11_NODE_18681_length_484_cov_0.664935_1_plen_75_part_10
MFQSSLLSKLCDMVQFCTTIGRLQAEKTQCENNLRRYHVSMADISQTVVEKEDILRQQESAHATMLSDTQQIKDA